jgi:DNA polymerase-3 subunit delta'
MNDVLAHKLHPAILERLKQLRHSSKLPTALLFAGRKGVGKWVIAEQLALELTCLEQPRQDGCRCASCRQVEHFSHPDVHYLLPLPANDKLWPENTTQYLHSRREDPFDDSTAAATQFILLDSVRRFQTNLSRKPSLSQVKFGIISEAERMLPATMDSLLKLLEEPPADTQLIVMTHKPGLLLPTILSRLQRVNFPALSDDFVREYLLEKCEFDSDQVAVFARLLRGSLNGIAELSEGDLLHDRDACWKILQEAFTMSPPNLLVKHGESSQLISRDSVEQTLRQWQMFLRDLLLLKTSTAEESPGDDLCYPDLEPEYRKLVADTNGSGNLFAYLEKVETTLQELRRNVNARMAAFDFLSELAKPAKT